MKVHFYFLLTAFGAVCLAQLERCPGLSLCSKTTSEKFKATNDTAMKCAALHGGLNCLEAVKQNCPQGYRITLERTIRYSRTELSRLRCSIRQNFVIPGADISGADLSHAISAFYIVFFVTGVLCVLQ